MQDLEKIRDDFKKELENGKNGLDCSLPFLKTKIPGSTNPSPFYQVMVIGGTNFSSADVMRSGFNIDLSNIEKEKLGSFDMGEKLLEFILKKLNPDTEYLCLNFAFPMESLIRDNRLDGKLKWLTKEQQFSDLIGKNIGEEIEKFVEKKTNRKIKVAVANDIDCLLLSGLTVAEKKGITAMILGTGFNAGLFLSNDTLVNLEAGNFDKFAQSEAGMYVSDNSSDEDKSKFEKEISGAYLYKKFNYYALKNNLPTISSTQNLFDLAFGENTSDSLELAKKVIGEAAGLIASVLAGISMFKNSEIEVVIQGSLFTDGFKDLVLEEYQKLSNFSMRFYKIQNSSRLGAAYLL